MIEELKKRLKANVEDRNQILTELSYHGYKVDFTIVEAQVPEAGRVSLELHYTLSEHVKLTYRDISVPPPPRR